MKKEENIKLIEKKLAKPGRACYTKQRLMRGKLAKKEVNESNERRNPSQLSADYDYMRLR